MLKSSFKIKSSFREKSHDKTAKTPTPYSDHEQIIDEEGIANKIHIMRYKNNDFKVNKKLKASVVSKNSGRDESKHALAIEVFLISIIFILEDSKKQTHQHRNILQQQFKWTRQFFGKWEPGTAELSAVEYDEHRRQKQWVTISY